MKWSAERDKLTSKCVDLLGKIVTTKAAERPEYSSVTIRAQRAGQVTISGFSLYGSLLVQLAADVEEDGEVSIPLEGLSALLNTLHKSDILTFISRGRDLQVTAHRAGNQLFTVELTPLSGEFVPLEHPPLVAGPEFSYSTDGLTQVFTLCDKRDYTFRHRGIYFSGPYVFGGTAHGLAILKAHDIGEEIKTVDPTVADVLKHYDEIHANFSGSDAFFRNSDGSLQFFARYVTSPPPNIRKFLDSVTGPEFTFDRGAALDALKQAQALAVGNNLARFLLGKEQILVENHSIQRGQGQFFIPAQGESGVEVSLSVPAMVAALGAFCSENISIIIEEDGRLAKLESENFSVVVPAG